MRLRGFFMAGRESQDDGRGLPGAASEVAVQRELGFDPDSPDLGDPQIDPPWPARIPQTDGALPKRAPGEQYPPYGR
jgi:hypothetical protein